MFLDKISEFWKKVFDSEAFLSDEEFDELEYNAKLEDHEIGNQRFYRLYYVNYHNIGGRLYGRSESESGGEILSIYKPFELPGGMTREDAFKVLSYLTDFIEKHPSVEVASWKSVSTLDSVLDLNKYGFKRLDFQPADEDIIDLFTVTGRIARFKNKELYSRYFNWYVDGVTREEVVDIYKKIGLTFEDIVFKSQEKVIDSDKDDSFSKVIDDIVEKNTDISGENVLVKRR